VIYLVSSPLPAYQPVIYLVSSPLRPGSIGMDKQDCPHLLLLILKENK
jgi:hypothetical protein